MLRESWSKHAFLNQSTYFIIPWPHSLRFAVVISAIVDLRKVWPQNESPKFDLHHASKNRIKLKMESQLWRRLYMRCHPWRYPGGWASMDADSLPKKGKTFKVLNKCPRRAWGVGWGALSVTEVFCRWPLSPNGLSFFPQWMSINKKRKTRW